MSKWRNGYDEIGFNSPDWANAIDALNVPSTAAQLYSYTATDDGWLAGLITGGLYNNYEIGTINGVPVFETWGVSGVRQFENGLFVKVNKGDVFEITFSAGGGSINIKLVPHK